MNDCSGLLNLGREEGGGEGREARFLFFLACFKKT